MRTASLTDSYRLLLATALSALAAGGDLVVLDVLGKAAAMSAPQ